MKKYKNTFRFSVAHAIKKNFILPLATFVLSMIFYLTGFCWDVLREAKNKAAITGQDVMKLMREAYEVFIFDSERAAYEPLISFYPALLVVISLLVGVLLFRFVTNKKTVNVYYSLGIKRADLYTARLLAGVFMMLAAVLVPLAVSLFDNAEPYLLRLVRHALANLPVLCGAQRDMCARRSYNIGGGLELRGYGC